MLGEKYVKEGRDRSAEEGARRKRGGRSEEGITSKIDRH